MLCEITGAAWVNKRPSKRLYPGTLELTFSEISFEHLYLWGGNGRW